MTNEPITETAPLAVVAVSQPSSTVYERAVRLAHRRLWIFTVSFGISAYFLILAALQLPSYYEAPSAEMLLTLHSGILVLAAVLLIFQSVNRKKVQNETYRRAVIRNGHYPIVFRFYSDRVETVSVNSRMMMPYSGLLSVVEDFHGLYLSNGELVLMLPAAGLTPYDADVIRRLLREQLPTGVYRRHRALVGRMPQPHPIPMYPDRPVVPPQLLHNAAHERPFMQTFLTLALSSVPMLLLLTTPVATMLVLLCGITSLGSAAAISLSLLLLSLFPLYLYAKRSGPLMQPPVGLSLIGNGWRLYRREGEWLLPPEDVLIRRTDDCVHFITPYGELLADIDSCREHPDIWAKIG